MLVLYDIFKSKFIDRNLWKDIFNIEDSLHSNNVRSNLHPIYN